MAWFWDVIWPLARPGLMTLSIFTFVGSYHSFFWPLVMMYTLPVGLMFFDSTQAQQTNLLMAAICYVGRADDRALCGVAKASGRGNSVGGGQGFELARYCYIKRK